MRKLLHLITGHSPHTRKGGKGRAQDQWAYNPSTAQKTSRCDCGYRIVRPYTPRRVPRVADVASRPDWSSAPDNRPAPGYGIGPEGVYPLNPEPPATGVGPSGRRT